MADGTLFGYDVREPRSLRTRHIHMADGVTSFYFILSCKINAYQKQIKVISVTSEMI